MSKTGISENTNAAIGIRSHEEDYSPRNKQIDLKCTAKSPRKTTSPMSMSDIEITEDFKLDVDKIPDEENVIQTSPTVDISRDRPISTTSSSNSHHHLIDKTKVIVHQYS